MHLITLVDRTIARLKWHINCWYKIMKVTKEDLEMADDVYGAILTQTPISNIKYS
ncbi:MAG: hypothetical protein ACI9VT_000139 [Psychroserpens sp.]|jgi:hypothetical protein